MARKYGQLLVDIWKNDDYKALGVDAQWTYEMLCSQSDINYCGVIPYRPKRWSEYSADMSVRRIRNAVTKLAEKGYIVVDGDTEELFVRTFMKHNKVLAQDQLRKSMTESYGQIASKVIKSAVWEAAERLQAGVLPKPEGDPGPQGGGQGADHPADMGGASTPGIGVTDVVSGVVPVPEPVPSSSSSDREPHRQPADTASGAEPDPAEEEDFASIEARRRLRQRQVTTKIPWPEKWKRTTATNLRVEYCDLAELMRHDGYTEQQIADEVYRRNSGGLSVVREPCGACVGGLIFVGDDAEPCPVCTPRKRAAS